MKSIAPFSSNSYYTDWMNFLRVRHLMKANQLCNLFGLRRLLALLFSGGFVLFSISANAQLIFSNAADLTLKDYLHEVLQHNNSIQAQMLDAESNRRRASGELGAFEPQFEASIMQEVNKRTNSVQQEASQSGQGFFSERNTIYDSGIEALIPTGGKVRLGATMSDLGNNVNPNPLASLEGQTNGIWTRQYQTFVGATLTQPLLKDGWLTPVLAQYRLAALDSGIAFQEYRQKLMLTIYQAEGTYWNLYFAQEQVRFYDQSVSVAQEVLNDASEKVKAGQGAELDVMEAQSALALRNTKRNDAMQTYYDALGHLQMLTGMEPDPIHAGAQDPAYRVVDDPHTANSPPDYQTSFIQVFERNPDYLIQRQKVDEERLRLGVAKNELLPELDFKAAYGFNGLGSTPENAWDVATTEKFPSWSVGLELTVPLGGNIRGRNFYKAAQLKWQEAYLNLRDVQTQIASSLSMTIQKARAWQQSIQSYETVVRYNKELLQTQLARLKAGTAEAQKVLDVEADLLDSQQDLASALGQYRRALLEVELNSGTILKNRGIDITREELRRQTEEMLDHNNAVAQKIPRSPNDYLYLPASTQPSN